MTIHTDHPFATPEDLARRFRGRLGGAVSLLTSGSTDTARAGLTVSSLMVANGEPPRVLLLVDPLSEIAEQVPRTGTAVCQLLSWRHRQLAEAFAGVAPAPGGPFRAAEFVDTAYGPRLADVRTWAGLRLQDSVEVGWSRLLTLEVADLEVGPDDDPLEHRRGRYHRPARGSDRQGPGDG